LSLERHPESVRFEDVFEVLHMLDLIDENLQELEKKQVLTGETPFVVTNTGGLDVDCNYEEKGVWYPGRITPQKRQDGKFDIEYDDGDNESNVDPRFVRARQPQSTISPDPIIKRYKFCRRLYSQFKMVLDPDSDKGDLHMLQNWLTPEKEAHWVINSRRADAEKSPLFLVHKYESNDVEYGKSHDTSAEDLAQSKQRRNLADKIEALESMRDEMNELANLLHSKFTEGMFTDQSAMQNIAEALSFMKLRSSTAQSAGGDISASSRGVDSLDEGTDERTIINYPSKWSGSDYTDWCKDYRDYDMSTLEDLRSGLNLCDPNGHEKLSIDLASEQFQHVFDLASTLEGLRRSGHLNYRTYAFGVSNNFRSRKQERKLIRDDTMDDVQHTLAKLWRANEDDTPLTEELLTEEELPCEKEKRLAVYSKVATDMELRRSDELQGCGSLEDLRIEFKKQKIEPVKKFYAQKPSELKMELDEKKQHLKQWKKDVTELKAKRYFLNFLSLSQVT
jgi:hypothetical protein